MVDAEAVVVESAVVLLAEARSTKLKLSEYMPRGNAGYFIYAYVLILDVNLKLVMKCSVLFMHG